MLSLLFWDELAVNPLAIISEGVFCRLLKKSSRIVSYIPTVHTQYSLCYRSLPPKILYFVRSENCGALHSLSSILQSALAHFNGVFLMVTML